jgi:hypothetical protein
MPGSKRQLSGGGLGVGGSLWPVEGWMGVDSEGRGDLSGRRLAGGGLGSQRPEMLEGKAGRCPVELRPGGWRGAETSLVWS